LQNSPYKDRLANAQRFLQALSDRSKEIPNLVSPHLGNGVDAGLTTTSAPAGAQLPAAATNVAAKQPGNVLVALPLGGRIKVEPWDNQLRLLKSKPVGTVAEDEVTPFEVTPFMFYLTRQTDNTTAEVPSAISVKSQTDTPIPDIKQ
jgi:hypothetical protein